VSSVFVVYAASASGKQPHWQTWEEGKLSATEIGATCFWDWTGLLGISSDGTNLEFKIEPDWILDVNMLIMTIQDSN